MLVFTYVVVHTLLVENHCTFNPCWVKEHSILTGSPHTGVICMAESLNFPVAYITADLRSFINLPTHFF